MILLGLLSVSKPNFFSLLCQLIKRNKETLLPGNAARLVANTVASARHLEDIGDDRQHLVFIMTVIRLCHQLIITIQPKQCILQTIFQFIAMTIILKK